MPTYLITAPDGRKFKVTGQGSKEDALAFIQSRQQPKQLDPSEYDSSSPEYQAKYGPLAGMSTTDKVLAGAGRSFVELGRGVKQAFGGEVDVAENRRLDAPLTESTAGKVGGVVGGVAATAPALAVPGVNTVAGAGLLGAAYGAAQPVAEDESRLGNTAIGGAFGAAGQAIGGQIAKGAGRFVASRTARAQAAAAPTIQSLRQSADRLYQAADNSGVVVSRAAMQRIGQRLQARAAKEGIDQTLHPKALASLQRVTGTSDNVSLKGMEILRRVMSDAASSSDRAERRIARILLDEFDQSVNGLSRRDVLAGNPADAKLLGQARTLWAKLRKAETIERLFERAGNRAGQFSGSGYENAVRTEFRQLVQNESRMRGFTPLEREAIKRVARGGRLDNTMRWLGKFAPTNVVAATLAGGLGYAVAGPAGLGLAAAGLAGRQAATAMTARNARIASEIVRRGGPPPVASPLLLGPGNALMRASGAAGRRLPAPAIVLAPYAEEQ